MALLYDENGDAYIDHIFIDLSKMDWSKGSWGPRQPHQPLTPKPPKVYPVVHKHWPVEAWRNCPDCKEKRDASNDREHRRDDW